MPKLKTNSGSKKEVRPYRNRKDQEKTCLQESYSYEEDQEAEAESYTLRHR
jgi:hypothetical protein